jgi:hypothetical protein
MPFTNRIVDVDRVNAAVAIREAADPDRHQTALDELARGDAKRAQGKLDQAIEHYRNARKYAL